MKTKIFAIIAGSALASSVALADDAVTVTTTALETATVVAAPLTDAAAPVATAKLDAAVIGEAGAMEAFGMSSSVTTGLIFFVVAATAFTVSTDGNAQGAPSQH